jgi:SAM-dependent methyltransferase
MNLHYGCGMSTGQSWYNCDGSPTLRLQRLPLLGWLFRQLIKPRFPSDVHYGDIVSGLPLSPGSCDAVFCCHVLEHLALEDFRRALRNTHAYLKLGGTFRLIVPDLEQCVKGYLSEEDPGAASRFMGYTHLGRRSRPKGPVGLLRQFIGNSHHLWMWDYKGLSQELTDAGFIGIRRYGFDDDKSPAFREVETRERFDYSVAVECARGQRP